MLATKASTSLWKAVVHTCVRQTLLHLQLDGAFGSKAIVCSPSGGRWGETVSPAGPSPISVYVCFSHPALHTCLSLSCVIRPLAAWLSLPKQALRTSIPGLLSLPGSRQQLTQETLLPCHCIYFMAEIGYAYKGKLYSWSSKWDVSSTKWWRLITTCYVSGQA